MNNPRYYGYGKSPKPIGSPKITEELESLCPHCGCEKTFAIWVELPGDQVPPMLRRPKKPHRIVGRYIGCAACPWASRMAATAELLES